MNTKYLKKTPPACVGYQSNGIVRTNWSLVDASNAFQGLYGDSGYFPSTVYQLMSNGLTAYS